jgi:hypothetical protein
MTSASSSPVLSALWRRLDAPGHDTCRLLRLRDGGPAVAGWQLEGTAVFRHEDGRPAQLHYLVHCDESWRRPVAPLNVAQRGRPPPLSGAPAGPALSGILILSLMLTPESTSA